ncbi:MAG: hypothetical protein AB1601_10350 [Planctomycetota bacterium]
MPFAAAWHALHRRPRRTRWPLKTGAFVIVVLLVLFPRVWLIPAWLIRLSDLDAVIDPCHPTVNELAARVADAAGPNPPLHDATIAVETLVRQRVPYAFDWETWGVMDYLPTVDEVFAQGREDCDGQAVVAASVLRRLGYDAWLVSDLLHTWVDAQDTTAEPPRTVQLMSPGRGDQTLTGGAEGTRARFSLATLANVGRALSFGVAVFPAGRELIIVAALWLVLVQPRSPGWRRLAGGAALLVAVLCLRSAGGPALGDGYRPGLTGLGLASLAAGCVLLMYRSPEARAETGEVTSSPPPGSLC